MKAPLPAIPPTTGASRPRELRLLALEGMPRVQPGDELAELLAAALARSGLEPLEGDVLVVAQKIVSKAEGRLVSLATVQPSERACEMARVSGKDPRLVELVLQESTEVLRCRPGVIVVEHRLGFVMANAGIDQSNIAQGEGDDCALLLPRDPDASCAALRAALEARFGVGLAVVVIDSHGRAWRQGTVGVAIGAAGLPALLDLRGQPDLFGRALRTSELGLADELASAASLLMGQADEGCPAVLARGVPYARRNGCARELLRPRAMDFFR